MSITEQPAAPRKQKKKHVRPAPVLPLLLRYSNLFDKGIVTSWMQLGRLIDQQGFPTGRLLSANTRVWTEDEVNEWLASRPTGKKPVPGRSSTEAA